MTSPPPLSVSEPTFKLETVSVQFTPAQGVVRGARGVGLATISATLSVAAHTAAGGALPNPAVTAIITALLASIGIALADRQRGHAEILGVLSTNQLAFHIFFQFSGAHSAHAHHPALSFSAMQMTFGHALAVILTGLLLTHAERVLFALARFFRSVMLPPSTHSLPAPTELRVVCIPARSTRQLAELIAQRIHAVRGPPTLQRHRRGICAMPRATR